MKFIAVLTRRLEIFNEFMYDNFESMQIIEHKNRTFRVREDPDENLNDIIYIPILNPTDVVGRRFNDFIVLEDSETDIDQLKQKLLYIEPSLLDGTPGKEKYSLIFYNENA